MIAPDISGHGSSEGSKIQFDFFSNDLATLIQSFENEKEIFALIGHSAGGLGAMAGRGQMKIKAKNYICIATPSYPYPPIKVAQKKLRLSPAIIDLLKRHFASQFSCGWDEVTKKSFHKNSDEQLLLIYDRNDRYLEKGDSDRILKYWPDAKVHMTENIGHEALIRADETIEQIAKFLLK